MEGENPAERDGGKGVSELNVIPRPGQKPGPRRGRAKEGPLKSWKYDVRSAGTGEDGALKGKTGARTGRERGG